MAKSLLNIIILLITTTIINAQDYSFNIKGKIVDENLIPIPDVQIKSKKKLNEVRTSSNGTFSINYSYQEDYYIVFNHVGYISDTLYFSKRKAKKWKSN